MKNEPDWKEIECLLVELITMQQKKVLACGKAIVPKLTLEDTMQPNDYIELEQHPVFRFEEGILIGMRTVQTALHAMQKDKDHVKPA